MENSEKKFYWRSHELKVLRFRHTCYRHKHLIRAYFFTSMFAIGVTVIIAALIAAISKEGFSHELCEWLLYAAAGFQFPMIVTLIIFKTAAENFDLETEDKMYRLMWSGDLKIDQLISRLLRLYMRLIKEKAFMQSTLGHAGHVAVGKIPVQFGGKKFSVWKDSIDQLVIVDTPFDDTAEDVQEWRSMIPINFKGYILDHAKKDKDQCRRDLEKILIDYT